MPKSQLDHVCLCAIVRDEEMNPAGGIMDFLDCTLPHGGSAVVVDTGSADKTMELLTAAQKRYSHLHVADYLFDGYAPARNFSLRVAINQKLGHYALVLDADERLFEEDFCKLGELSEKYGRLIEGNFGINLMIRNIDPDTSPMQLTTDSYAGLHNPRFFTLSPEFRYATEERGYFEEHLYWRGKHLACETTKTVDGSVVIKHFRPEDHAATSKERWYRNLKDINLQIQRDNPHFAEWKKLNPKRALYPKPKNA